MVWQFQISYGNFCKYCAAISTVSPEWLHFKSLLIVVMHHIQNEKIHTISPWKVCNGEAEIQFFISITFFFILPKLRSSQMNFTLYVHRHNKYLWVHSGFIESTEIRAESTDLCWSLCIFFLSLSLFFLQNLHREKVCVCVCVYFDRFCNTKLRTED